jgi:hypothetical protein
MNLHFSIISIALATLTVATSVRYDVGYDDSARSLDTVACSNGDNGLETKYEFATQGDVPTFPNVGSSWEIEGWNSPNVRPLLHVHDHN